MLKKLFRKAIVAALTEPERPRAAPKRFVVLKPDGSPNGFYSDDIHAALHIPAGAVELTEEQYQRWHKGFGAEPMRQYRMIGNEMVEIPR